SSGLQLQPQASLLAPVAEPSPPAPPANAPKIGVFQIPFSSPAIESAGATRYLLDGWGLPYRDLSAADIRSGALADVDVLIVPDGYANYGLQALGAKGKKAIRDWVNAGGRLVAWQGGAVIAAKSGASTAKFSGSHTNMPGTLVRVSLDPSSPLAAGVGELDWVMYQDDARMAPGLGSAVGTFPAFGDPDYATSGLTIGVQTLAGTSVVSDEAVGSGRVISFSIDPNFRGWTQGTQRLLWNAIVGPDPAGFGPGLFAGSKAR